MSKYISRRQLLRNLIVGIGGITLAACGPKTEIVEKEVTRVVKETVEVEKEVEKEVTKVVSEEKVVEKVVTATPAPSKVINDLGIELPDDAAPNDQQYIYSEGGDLAGFLEFFKSSFYQGGSGGAFCPVVQASLMRLNEDGQAIPEAAEEYPTVSSDGLTWTFKIRRGWNGATVIRSRRRTGCLPSAVAPTPPPALISAGSMPILRIGMR